MSIFDNLDVRKYFIAIDGARYSRDSVLTNYNLNEYFDQYRDLKLFYQEDVSEERMTPFISYPDLKKTPFK